MTINSPSASSSTSTTHSTSAVQVALRIRPLTRADKAQPRFSQCTDSDVLKTFENTVAVIPHQKSFQFDYGQTSSGKTYTMGTAANDNMCDDPEQEGIIPRAMTKLFQRILEMKKEAFHPKASTTIAPRASTASSLRIPTRSTSTVKLRPVSMIIPPRQGSNGSSSPLSNPSITAPSPPPDKTPRYTVYVSFVEIYNEELIDLLNPAPPGERPTITIREDSKGHIIWTGLKELQVGRTEDILRYLQMGSENRATGSTDMNAKSSRSHAIFSVTLKQERWRPSNSPSKSTLSNRNNTLNVKAMVGQMEKQARLLPDEEPGEWIITNSKFHFVDLAGSERLKRTAAKGNRRKEGISINAGLLALGNVISALSEPHKKSTYIPYRDSKLTRLLQDSLGGNSTTLMIACVSPAEVNLTETANTIKYAYRARSIRNKVERNQTEEWMSIDNVDQLRQIIQKLKTEVRTLRGIYQRYTPSPMSCVSPQPYTSFSSRIMSPSTSLSDTDPHMTLSASISASTNITVPDTGENLESPLEKDEIVRDLQRQIEELQNEVAVTRERNTLVENELQTAKNSIHSDVANEACHDDAPLEEDKRNDESKDLVEPVIEEYKNTISGLEDQLAYVKTTLTDSEAMLSIQQEKINKYEAEHTIELKNLEELKSRLEMAIQREQKSENYSMELESQLEVSVRKGERDQQVLSELHEKIIKFKEMDLHTEQYINDLEVRLSESESQQEILQNKLKALSEDNCKLETSGVDNHFTNSSKGEDEPLRKQELVEELSVCRLKCEELTKEILLLKEQQQRQQDELENNALEPIELEIFDKFIQSEPTTCKHESHINDLTMQLELKSEELEETQAIIHELRELCASHTTHSKEQYLIRQLEDTITELKINDAQNKFRDLQKHMWEQEQSTQIALQTFEEKQDAIIHGLETKSLRDQLDERNNEVKRLESANRENTKKLSSVLRDKRLQKVMLVMEEKSEKTRETLEDIKHQYKVREEEFEEKRRTEELSKSLKHISYRASQGDEMVKNLIAEVTKTKSSLEEQTELNTIDIQRNQALELRIQELENQLEKEKITEEIENLEDENKDSAYNDSEKTEDTDAESLEQELTKEAQIWKTRYEAVAEKLYNINLNANTAKLRTKSSDSSLTKKSASIHDSIIDEDKLVDEYMESEYDLYNDNTISDSDFVSEEEEDILNRMPDVPSSAIRNSQQHLEDNSHLAKQNTDLESQLSLQRSQLTLESKNLELELLQKELEQTIPRNSITGASPRATSPLMVSSNSFGMSSVIQYKSHRDSMSSNMVKLSKSGSYRSVTNIFPDHDANLLDEEPSKRFSTLSMRSDLSASQLSSSVRHSRNNIDSSNLPPPTAPPSNPLPPIPTPLPPPPPGSPTPQIPRHNSITSATVMQPSYSYNTIPRQRHDSITSTTFSETMNGTNINNLTAEKYEKLVRSLQRNMQVAENDVRAHQEVISKLETQLSRSESSVRDVKKQLDVLNKEKMAYNLELQNLRSQVTQVQDKQKMDSEKSIVERKKLEEELQSQKQMKEKAEKARRILENRMEELMSKKSKFMCF
ncbi:kinesin-domain-containing protein [Backusella circina FSU 941]|nr:kinesin-domain-containing protein [Backusella circina FSU 941]